MLNLLAAVCLSGVCPLQSGSVSGLVIADNGKPVWGASISAYGHPTAKSVSTRSDSSGHFELKGLQPGTWTLDWSASEYWHKREYMGTFPSPPKPFQVEVSPGASVQLKLNMIRSAVFSGRILRPDGKPLVYRYAVLLGYCNMHGADYRSVVQTDSQGRFRALYDYSGTDSFAVNCDGVGWADSQPVDFQPAPRRIAYSS